MYSARRVRIRSGRGAVALAAAALMLAGCSSSPSSPNGGGGDDTTKAAPAAAVRITPSGTDVNPGTPITITADNAKLNTVTVVDPDNNNPLAGKIAPDGKTWTSSAQLEFGTSYVINADATGADGKKVHQNSTVKTLVPEKKINANMIPAPGTVAKTGVGVGQPIVFQFTKPVTDKNLRAEIVKHLNVVSTPVQEGAWYWTDNENVHYRPKVYWQAGTKIQVSANIYGLDFGNGAYGAENRNETYKVHDSWIAKADGNTEQMQIFHNGKNVKTMPISMGKDATPTHLGAHVISFKSANYTMDSCTYGVCSGPGHYRSAEKYSNRISNDGEFVHENPNSVGQQGSSNVSHGCINLNASNAAWFFDNFELGDVVEVANSGGKELPVYDLYGDWSLSWDQWKAGSQQN